MSYDASSPRLYDANSEVHGLIVCSLPHWPRSLVRRITIHSQATAGSIGKCFCLLTPYETRHPRIFFKSLNLSIDHPLRLASMDEESTSSPLILAPFSRSSSSSPSAADPYLLILNRWSGAGEHVPEIEPYRVLMSRLRRARCNIPGVPQEVRILHHVLKRPIPSVTP